MADAQRFVEFTIRGLAIDPRSKLPILLLQDPQARLVLPIWIGAFEASAIMSRIEGRTPPRPMTHDLAMKLVGALGGAITGIDIRALDQGTFLGSLHLRTAGGDALVLDCRPSDGIALAVRAGVPIRVETKVLEAAQPAPRKAGEPEPTDIAPTRAFFISDDDEAGRERLARMLADMDKDDFGDYEM